MGKIVLHHTDIDLWETVRAFNEPYFTLCCWRTVQGVVRFIKGSQRFPQVAAWYPVLARILFMGWLMGPQHLELPSLGYSKQFYHILFSPPTQNLLLQSSFSASLVPHPTPSSAPQIWPAYRRHYALYIFVTYLLTLQLESFR